MDGSDAAVPGWWLASDGRWYQPEDLPAGWEIGSDGRPVRVLAPGPPAEPPDPSEGVVVARRSFVVTTAPAAPSGASADPARGALLERRWWAAVPAVAVLALVIAYVLVGGGGGGDAQVLGLVERRATSTSAPDRVSGSTATPGSASTAVGDPDRLAAGGIGAKPPTTTLAVLPGRNGSFAPTTTLPRSGPVPTTSRPAVIVPVTTTVAGAPTTGSSSTSVPAGPPSSVPPPTSAPPSSVPPTSAPGTSAPPTTVPRTTVPRTTVPPTSAPATSAPATSAPPTTVPRTTVPSTTVPPTTTTTLAGATCSAGVSDATPRRGDNVTVTVLSSVRNAPVELTIRYRSGAVTRTGTTSILGLASLTFDIGDQPAGYLVVVDVAVGAEATCRTSFRPH